MAEFLFFRGFAMSDTTQELVLTFSCEDQPGIVAAVTGLFSLQGFNIREASQFEDTYEKRFFMRTLLESVEGPKKLSDIQGAFQSIADRYGMTWKLTPVSKKPRVLIAVSQWGHCLNTLLNAWKGGSLPIEITGIVSNHQTMQSLTEWYGLPYHYLPVTAQTKKSKNNVCSIFLNKPNRIYLYLRAICKYYLTICAKN